MLLSFLFYSFLISCAFGHGRLTSPLSRVLHTNYENDPTGNSNNGGNNNNAWVCRHANPTTSQATLTAGGSVDLTWFFGAKHVGDCDAYLSYDVSETLDKMTWFKIANFYDCRTQSNNEAHTMQLPSWLPSGPAVLRWGWYALHVWPSVEFYSQCSDVTIVGTQSSLPAGLVKYPLINPPVFPVNGNDGVGYPNRFPPTQDWMVGPACAMGETHNSCDLTKAGTEGHLAVTGTTETGDAQGRCGTSTGDAASSCGSVCTQDSDCSTGTCQIGVNACVTNTIGNRCGTTWTNADSKCGTSCEQSDVPCPSGETCYADMTKSCTNDVPTDVVTTAKPNPGFDDDGNCISNTWTAKEGKPIDDSWCQTSCVTLNYCDSDLCECYYSDGTFSLSILALSFTTLLALF